MDISEGKMFDKLLGMFGVNSKQESKRRVISKEQERKIVASLSRGNIHLQAGRYLTEADIDEMRKKAFS